MAEPASSRRRWFVWALQALVLLMVVAGVGRTVRSALDQLSEYEWHVQPTWLVAAGVVYLAGLVPMAWFWRRTLAALGQAPPWPATLRAYFLGHVGKYVPGKAMVVILRVAAVRRWVTSMRIAIVSTLLETLTMMSVGAFLVAALSIAVLQMPPLHALLAAGIAAAAGLPTIPPIARRLAGLGLTKLKQDEQVSPQSANDVNTALRGINASLLAQGWLASCVCWLFLGLSLWAVLRAIGVGGLDPLHDLPLLVAAIALAVVAGFASMLPGGLGVRDLLLVQLLAPYCGSANALIAAVLVRLVWLVSEVAACVILYVGARSRGRGAGSREI